MRTFSCIAFTLLSACSAALAQSPEGKTAEEMYKNITALKGAPGDQLLPAMQFMASALGVNCEFCHVAGKMDADDNGAKKTAREMIAMQNEINKTAFHGQRQVTCMTCHRGSARPVSVPAVLESDAAPKPSAPAAAPAGAAVPTPDAIIEKYIAALGGADALRKATTRVMTGKIITGGSEGPVEVTTKAPNKRVTVTHMGGTASYTAFDGTAGWMGSTGRQAREMSAAESAASSLDAEFALGLRLKEIYPQLRRGRPEEANGVMCEVLNGAAPGKPAVRLYFAQDSGLLVRMVRYAETPLGRNPTQLDYADYRDAGGVKVPYRWTLSRPNGRFTIQIDEVKANIPVDDAKFVRPSGDVK
jgi:photosynthetic reaction center cytochrome c subunit